MRFPDILMAASQGGGFKYDALASTYFAGVVSAGGSVSVARKALVNNLIVGLRSDGDLASLDYMLLLCAEDSQGALLDVISGVTATAVNSPTFTANQGYAGNGTTSYVNSNFNASTMGVAYTNNSCHLMIYDRTSRTGSTLVGNCGANDATPTQTRIGTLLLGGFNGDLNDQTNLTGANANAQGLYINSRTSSVQVDAYLAGASIASSGAATSTGVANVPFFIGGENSLGVLARATTDQHGFFSCGGGMTAAQALRVNTRVQTFLTGVGL